MREEQRRRARILVVDDEPQNVRYVSDVLIWAGYENVEGLTDPAEALERFPEYAPDLVILDLLMPGMDGFELMEAMRASLDGDEYLPFLILTSDISSESRRRALSTGAKDFLTKPMSPTEVRLRVDNLLETRVLYLELARVANGSDETRAPVSAPAPTAAIDETELLEFWAASLDLVQPAAEGRSKRVAWVAGRIAEGLDLPEEVVVGIRHAALLQGLGARRVAGTGDHDLSESTLPHPSAGLRLLNGARHPVLQMTRRMLAGLDEWWDGTGGPSRLRGEAIPLESRIVAVARHWDDLQTAGADMARHVAATEALAGTRFDPKVVEALVQAQTVGA